MKQSPAREEQAEREDLRQVHVRAGRSLKGEEWVGIGKNTYIKLYALTHSEEEISNRMAAKRFVSMRGLPSYPAEKMYRGSQSLEVAK